MLQLNLLGSFPTDVRPDMTGYFACGQKATLSPLVKGDGSKGYAK